MLAYLAQDQVPNVDANPLRLLLGIFAPSLINFSNALAVSSAIALGIVVAIVPRWWQAL
jgi:hypothetical protein